MISASAATSMYPAALPVGQFPVSQALHRYTGPADTKSSSIDASISEGNGLRCLINSGSGSAFCVRHDT